MTDPDRARTMRMLSGTGEPFEAVEVVMNKPMTASDILHAVVHRWADTGKPFEADQLVQALVMNGYLIIRDPAHAPEAVEAAWKALTAVGPRAPTLCEVYHANNVCICQAETRAAVTAYIERAR